MIFLCLLLLISQVDIDYPPDDPVMWPLGPFVTPRRGYGQYNQSDDFHRGLDFHGSEGDAVFVPYPGQGFWVLAVSPDVVSGMCRADCTSVLIGVDQDDQWGWHYGHIDTDHEDYELEKDTYYSRNVVSLLLEVPYLGSHVHFSWLGIDSYAPGGPHPQHGYLHPIDYLGALMSFPYNDAAFSPTHAGPFQAFASITGIIFATEGVENVIPAQDKIYEVIDIIVRPYTYYYQNPENDSCIARRVLWRILRQNPSTLEYETYKPSLLGKWRTLYDFSEFIFDDNDTENYLAEYGKVFFGGMLHWSNNICLTNSCITARDDASFPGVETVWINPYSHQEDYNDQEYCRGGWDTRLCTTDGGTRANIDEAATFMDGRYAIQVLAVPQRIDNKTFEILPVDNITLPEPTIEGVIVNNWAPRITGIRLQDNPGQIIRYGPYEANIPNNEFAGRTLNYTYPGHITYPYVSTGDGYNEYSLVLWFSEPVTDLAPQVSMTLQLVTGLGPDVNWQDIIWLNLDDSSITSEGGVTAAVYRATIAQPPGYMGNQIVDLTITAGIANDLAEQELDADASTIVPALEGSSGSVHYETVHHLIMEYNTFTGYMRTPSGLDSEQDSRSTIVDYYDAIRIHDELGYVQDSRSTIVDYYDAIRIHDELGYVQDSRGTIYGCYDAIHIPDKLDDTNDELDDTDDEFDDTEWIYHEITPTGAWVGANLLHEINGLGMSGSTSCNLFGGAWMCKATTEDVLHAFIIDYNGNIKMDDVIFTSSPPEIVGHIHGGCATTVSLGSNEWERDRYGWIGWGKLTKVPEPTYPYQRDVTLYVNMYDAYTLGGTAPVLVGSGTRWFDDSPGQGILYETKVWSIVSDGDDGGVRVTIHSYPLGVTTYITTIVDLDPPRTGDHVSNTISQGNLSSTELSSRDIIDDYFTVFPNPVVSSLSINFMSSEAVGSTVRIYDISGHLVNTFVEELPGMQHHHIQWDLKDSNGHIVPTGIYYVSLVSGSLVETRTVVVIH